MKKAFIIILMSLICSVSYASPKIYRYVDKSTGDEKGLAYASKSGNPSISNPDWNAIEIQPDKFGYYMNLKNNQDEAKDKARRKAKKDRCKEIRIKLKALDFTDGEIDELIRTTQ